MAKLTKSTNTGYYMKMEDAINVPVAQNNSSN